MKNVALDGTATVDSFTVKWDAVQGANQYLVAWATDLDGDPKKVASFLVDGQTTSLVIDEDLNDALGHSDLNPMAGDTLLVEVIALEGTYQTADQVQASYEYIDGKWSARLTVTVPTT